jgi:hypothetical protein
LRHISDGCVFVWLRAEPHLPVSAALENSLPIVTPDEWIQRYPVQWIW